jgi:hypothetical protein
MAKDSKSDIDPRFDPAFQRGFDPSIPIESSVPPRQPRRAAPAPVELATAPAPTAPAAVPPAPAPAATPVASTAPAEPKAAKPAEVVAAEPDDAENGAIVETPAEDAPELSAVRNPFLLFLGIIAVALIAVGVWLFVRTGDAFNTSQVRSQGDYMTLTSTIYMAPFIALLGAATAIGVLFVFAARWRRRH